MATPELKAGARRGAPSPGAVALDGSKSDSVNLSECFRRLYVGAAGNAKLTMLDGTTETFVGLTAGQVLDVMFYRVWSTGTTSTGLLGLR